MPAEQVQAPSLADVLNASDHIKHHIPLQPEPCVSYVSHLSQLNPQTHTHTHTHTHTMACGKKKNHGKFDDNNNNNDTNDIADPNATATATICGGVIGGGWKKALTTPKLIQSVYQ